MIQMVDTAIVPACAKDMSRCGVGYSASSVMFHEGHIVLGASTPVAILVSAAFFHHFLSGIRSTCKEGSINQVYVYIYILYTVLD